MPDEPIPDGNGAVILRPGEDLRTQCELCPIKALRALATVHGLTDIKSIEGDQVPTRRTRLISAILLRMRTRRVATMNSDGGFYLTESNDGGAGCLVSVGADANVSATEADLSVGVQAGDIAGSGATGARERVRDSASAPQDVPDAFRALFDAPMIPLPKVRIRTEGFVNGDTPQSYVDNVRRLLVVNGLGDLAGSPGLRTLLATLSAMSAEPLLQPKMTQEDWQLVYACKLSGGSTPLPPSC